MKNLLLPTLLSLTLAGPALAQTMNHENMDKGMMKHDASDANKAASTSAMSDGEVKAVDKTKGTVTLNHGEIKSAKMPAMTMAYKAKDPMLLDKVLVGDKVSFALEPANGAYVVSRIEKR